MTCLACNGVPRGVHSMNLEELQEKRRQINRETDIIFENTQKIIDESNRVADVAKNAEQILEDIDKKFEICTGLKKVDVAFLFVAVALQIVRQYTLTQFPERLDDQAAAKEVKKSKILSGERTYDRAHRYYNPSLNEILGSPYVPFDANIGSNGALKGGKQMGHRVTALGHDPILGLVIGTANIATSTLTNKDWQSYHIYPNENNRDYFRNRADTGLVFSKTKDKLLNEGLEGKEKIGASLVKEIYHLRTDLNTKNSLPLPVISVINAGLAADLAKRGLDMSNVVAVGKQAGFSILINTLISMVHSLFYDESVDGNRSLYEVRTRKILSCSNVIASASNLIYVGGSVSAGNKDALRNLDIGGLIVTVYRVATDISFMRRLKKEFLEQEFFAQIRGPEFDFE